MAIIAQATTSATTTRKASTIIVTLGTHDHSVKNGVDK
jgi:hypothetical protein